MPIVYNLCNAQDRGRCIVGLRRLAGREVCALLWSDGGGA